MQPIGLVSEKYGVPIQTLRNWENAGLLGKVSMDSNGRVYSEEQIEKIKAIKEFVDDRKREKKRTNYKEMQDFLTDRFGGEIRVREETLPVGYESINSLFALLSSQDRQLQQVLGENKELLGKVDQVITENEQMQERMDTMSQKLDEMIEQMKQKEEEDASKKSFFQRIFSRSASKSIEK